MNAHRPDRVQSYPMAGFFSKGKEVDAENFYSEEVEKLKGQMEKEESLARQSNSGHCFVVFRSKQLSIRYK